MNSREGFEPADKKKRMLLSAETLLGLRITSESKDIILIGISALLVNVLLALSFIHHIFTLPGVKVFLSQKICPGPSGKFFWLSAPVGRNQ